MPGLAISLSLQIGKSDRQTDTQTDDLVAFVSSLLLGNDQAIRMWFSQFVKAGQKASFSSYWACRKLLLKLNLNVTDCEMLTHLIFHDAKYIRLFFNHSSKMSII